MRTRHKSVSDPVVHHVSLPLRRGDVVHVRVEDIADLVRRLDDYWGWFTAGKFGLELLDPVRLVVTESPTGRVFRVDAEVIGRRVSASPAKRLPAGVVLRRRRETSVRQLSADRVASPEGGARTWRDVFNRKAKVWHPEVACGSRRF